MRLRLDGAVTAVSMPVK